jgi:preprotein translocase subunit SecA
VGTERHESRRVDNQLRGRSGRQGDAGSSRFFLSLEDDLMRIFVGGERIQGILTRLGMEEGIPIEAGMVTKAIERAQTQVEGRNFEIRKHLLEYDDVMNKQRTEIYRLRRDILDGREGRDYVLKVANDIVDYVVDTHCPEKSDPGDWALTELATDMLAYFNINAQEQVPELGELGAEQIREELSQAVDKKYQEREERFGEDLMRVLERDVMLRVVDSSWKDHLLALDHLKEGISLRSYGQRKPIDEYKRESYDLFQAMKERVEDTILKTLFRLEPASEEQMNEERQRRTSRFAPSQMRFSAAPKEASGQQRPTTVVNKDAKVGRNAPCPCGSGRKYKKCCGQTAAAG